MLSLLLTYMEAFTVVKPATYTIESALVDSAQAHLVCVTDLYVHPAMIHAVMFTSQAYHDKSLGKPYSKLVLFHQAQTLYHLQQSLNHLTEALMPATLTVITTLASSAAIMGELEVLEKHMDGLYQVVQAQGGLKVIAQGSMIEHKAQRSASSILLRIQMFKKGLCRLDLGLSMGTGRKPRFFPDEISWGPQLARAAFATKVKDLKGLQPPPEPRFLNIWYDLKHFSAAANRATATGNKMSPELFSHLSTSVPNRLINLSYNKTSIDEVLRLSMLAYVKGLLVQIPGLGRKLWHLSSSLETALQAQQYPPHSELAGVLLWALVMAGLTIFEDFRETWFRAAIVQTAAVLGLRDWAEARLLLRDVLWVDIVFDQMAEALLQDVFHQDQHLSSKEMPT
jgi:hypothetical protein